jgi:hypothetical protein
MVLYVLIPKFLERWHEDKRLEQNGSMSYGRFKRTPI